MKYEQQYATSAISPAFSFFSLKTAMANLVRNEQRDRCYVHAIWLVFVILEQLYRSERFRAQEQITRKHQQCISLNRHGSFRTHHRHPAYPSSEKNRPMLSEGGAREFSNCNLLKGSVSLNEYSQTPVAGSGARGKIQHLLDRRPGPRNC